MSKLKPLFNRVVVEVVEQPTTTPSGLALPESVTKASQNTGKVVAVGAGVWRTPFDGEMVPLKVQVGDTVLFLASSALPLKLENKNYLIFDESSVLAILEN